MSAAAPPPGSRLAATLASGRYVRAVNYHATPAHRAGRLRSEIAALAARYRAVDEHDLEHLLRTGRWEHDRPGVLVCCFNGYRDNAEVIAPLLREAGLIGWFFVPTEWVGVAPAEQRAYARTHRIAVRHADPQAERVAMSWEDVRAVGEHHVIASHTHSHRALLPGLTRDVLETELLGSRELLESVVQRPVRTLAWLYGGGLGTDPVLDEVLCASGYRLLFANHVVQRLDPARAPGRPRTLTRHG